MQVSKHTLFFESRLKNEKKKMFNSCLQVRFILPFKQQQQTLIKLQRNLFSKFRFCERRSLDFVDFNLPLKEFNQKRIKSIWL
jgi:hypothetical protein